METINIFLLLAGLLLFISVVSSTLSARLGMPLLLLFLMVGMLAGEDGLGKIEFDDFSIAASIGQLALAVILLDGGLRTSLTSFRMALKPAAILASWGVIATVGCLGLFITWVLDVDWRMGMLMAAIVGSTDAAAVFALLRHSGVKLNERVQSTLEIESGANDPMAILLVGILVQSMLDPSSFGVSTVIVTLVSQLTIGALLGLFGGWVLSVLTSRLKLNEGMYALLILSGGLLCFSSINLVGGSGFLAVYLAGIVIGNRHSHATEHVLRVMDGLAWLSQAGLFVILGLLATPSQLLDHWFPAVLIALFLTFVARPIAVLASVWPFRYPRHELLFMSWVGLRGAVPVTLAMMPVMMGVAHSQMIFNVAFAVVMLSLLVQGASIPFMARLCKVDIPDTLAPADSMLLWVNGTLSQPLKAFHVDAGCNAIGRTVNEIINCLDPSQVRLVTIKRQERTLPFDWQGSLKEGDLVWFAVADDLSAELAAWFSDTDKDMLAQRMFFGPFSLNAEAAIGDIAKTYGLEIADEDRDKTLQQWLSEQFEQSEIVIGDKVRLSGCTLTVRHTNEEGKVTKVGLKVPEALQSV